MERSKRIKILVHNFLYPALIILALGLIKKEYQQFALPQILSAGALIAFLITKILQNYFSDDKFLIKIEIDNDKLILTYMNSLTGKSQLLIRSGTLQNVKSERNKFLVGDFSTITFTSEKNELTFKVFSSDLDHFKQKIDFFSLTRQGSRNLEKYAQKA